MHNLFREICVIIEFAEFFKAFLNLRFKLFGKIPPLQLDDI